MNALFAAAAEIQTSLQCAREKFCFIGGVALQRWGEPRLTRDVDLTLLCPYGAESPLVERLLAIFAPRMPDAREFALQHRVLLSAASRSRNMLLNGRANLISVKSVFSHVPPKIWSSSSLSQGAHVTGQTSNRLQCARPATSTGRSSTMNSRRLRNCAAAMH